MFRRKLVVQNELVSRYMRDFFWEIRHQPTYFLRQRNKKFFEQPVGPRGTYQPAQIAEIYGRLLWNNGAKKLVDEKMLARSRFYVGLSIRNRNRDFEQITKRASLISDTLLLSHDWTTAGQRLNLKTELPTFDLIRMVEKHHRKLATELWMHCPDLAELGKWILDAEPLLKAGLAWYLPSYSISILNAEVGKWGEWSKGEWSKPEQVKAIDYLVADGRAVDASGAEPIRSQLVRPILQIDLPFVEGVSLREFGKITVEEFASYSAFRDSLRQSFLDMDSALNAVQSDRELLKLSLQIKDHVRSVRSEMETARRKRAVAVSGAVIGSVGASLVAVYGPALAAAVMAIGATGSVWGIIDAAAKNSTRTIRQDKWYYVWALAKESKIHVI